MKWWISKSIEELPRIDSKDIDVIKDIEKLSYYSTALRVMYILWRVGRPVRLVVLAQITEMPVSSLQAVLEFLTNRKLIETEKFTVEIPRSEQVVGYRIAHDIDNFYIELFKWISKVKPRKKSGNND
jgi:hypothetical protein